MRDYSQGQEQPHILRALEGVQSRRLLDLGAWHPTEFSNSRALIEAGWQAILVECSPGPAKNLIKFYDDFAPDIQIIVGAIGFERHMIKIQATDDAVSTSDPATHEKWKKVGGYYGEFWTPQILLEEISNQFGGGYEFCNIDVEGRSVDVFKRLVDLEWRPRCVCVEYDDRLPELMTLAFRAGYLAEYVNAVNVVLKLK